MQVILMSNVASKLSQTRCVTWLAVKGSIKRSIKLTFNGINTVLFRFSDLIIIIYN